MLNKLMKYKKTLCFFGGALSVAALPPYYIFPLLFITFGIFLLILNQAATYKEAFKIGYWFGFGWFAFGFAWIGNALLVDAAAFGWLYPLVFLASGAFFGLFVGFPALFSAYFKNPYARWLAFASLWVIFEWIRSFILTGFPWNLLGSTLAFSVAPLQLASVIGTYGLSLLVLMAVTAPTLVIIRKDKTSALTAGAVVMGVTALICVYGHLRLSALPEEQDSAVTVRLVQPDIPQAMKWNADSLNENFVDYLRLSKSKPMDKINFVIWGETATPYALDLEPGYRSLITEAVPEDGYLITGLVRYEFETAEKYQPLNSLFIINRQGDIVDFYDKSHLVPFGEYIPLRKFFPNWIRPVTNTIADFKPGRGHKVFRLKDYPSFGTLICYEIIFPAQVVTTGHKPNFIINLTNDGWYGLSAGPYQHLVTARLRAVEEGLTVVRAANTGISAVISKTGRIIASLPLNHRGILDITLPKNMEITTPYGQFGNVIPLIFCFVNIMIAFFLNKKFN